MTFVELPVVPIYWHFPRTIKGYAECVCIVASLVLRCRSIIESGLKEN